MARLLVIFAFLALAQDRRLDVPAESALKEAEKSIKSLFKDDYAKRAPADRLALAKNLLKQGLETKDDPAARYVLFRESQDLAARGGDIETAFRAVDEMCRVYATNALVLKNAALVLAGGVPRTPEEQKTLTQAYLTLADDAFQARQFDLAAKASLGAVAAAKKVKDVPLLTKAEAQSRTMASILERYEKARKSIEALAATPDNPDANQAVGEFECFALGDWEAGLPKLAKGSDAALKTLAAKDLSKPTEGAELSALADAWWDRAEKESGPFRTTLRQRAAHWYEQASPKLSGLTKVKVDKRLEELAGQKSATDAPSSKAPGPVEGLVGWWRFEEGSGTEAKDSSPGKNHGTLIKSPEWTKGRIGRGLKFDGVDSQVVTSTKPYATVVNSFSMTLWASPAGSKEGYAIYPTVGSQAYGSTDHAGVGIHLTDIRIAVIEHTGGYLQTQIHVVKETKGWVHLAVVYTNRVPKLYIDGKLAETGPASQKTVHPGCIIGAGVDGKNFSGVLDEFRIYNRALSEAEVKALASQKGD